MAQTQAVRPFAAILWGGGLAATFDLTFAVVFNYFNSGVAPVRVFQSVASGWLGPAAFEGGAPAAALGIASHYFIVLVAAAVYWCASRRLAFLTQRAVFWGLLFGLAIYLFMHWVVLPLSAAPRFRSTPFSIGADLCSHLLLVGLVIALFARRYSEPR